MLFRQEQSYTCPYPIFVLIITTVQSPSYDSHRASYESRIYHSRERVAQKALAWRVSFLIAYGLKIYNEDREEGRAIVRALMKAEAPESSGSNTTNMADKVGRTLSSHQYGEIE
jgi:hypothetical protein